MLRYVFAAALLAPASALACPGSETTASASQTTELAAVNADPTHCAKNAALVGGNCAWSTGAMAQRVNTDGKDTTITAKLTAQAAALPSQVAVPFTVGGFNVIANTVIEQADPKATLAMSGKVLEVDGVKYFLVTSFQNANS